MKYLKKDISVFDKNIIKSLSEKLYLPEEIIQILFNKGYKSYAEIYEFLYPDLNNLFDPFLFNNMKNSIDLIYFHIQQKNRIAVYGDYDVDGVCATRIVIDGLKYIGADTGAYLPDRHKEGYGLNKTAIKYLYDKGAKLIITVDCGISAIEEIQYARELGIDVIITDHHEPSDILPNANYIIDAKVKNENYPFKELCGAGVAYKLVYALTYNDFNFHRTFFDLVGLATVADLVPLVGENRILVKNGLNSMNSYLRTGLKELSKHFLKSENTKITSYHLGYCFGPMLNAAGRLSTAFDSCRILGEKNLDVANALANKLYLLNEKRKNIEKNIMDSCYKEIEEQKKYNENEFDNHNNNIVKSIIMYNEEWNTGVIGIAASKIQEIYHCPVILFGKQNGLLHGSGRSIEGIDLYKTLSECTQYLESFGGHTMAAGLSLKEENFEIFKNKFNNLMNSHDNMIFENIIYYDEVLKLEKFNLRFVEKLSMFEPFGMGNPNFKFLLNNVNFKNVESKGHHGEHFSGFVYDETGTNKFIAFNKKIPESLFELDVIVSPSINEYNDNKTAQCIIHDFQPTEEHKHRNLVNQNTCYGTRLVDSSIKILGLPEKKQKQLENEGILTIKQLLEFFPKRYLDYRFPKLCKDVIDKESCAIVGTIIKVGMKTTVYAICLDENNNKFMACWFNQPYIYNQLIQGEKYIFCGDTKIVQNNQNNESMVQIYPKYFSKNIEKYKTMIPVYKKIKGMSVEYFKDNIVAPALNQLINSDYLEKSIVDDFNLMSTYDALNILHNPKNDVEITDAQNRIVFDQLFSFSLNLLSKSMIDCQKKYFKISNEKSWNQLRNSFKYELTGDQNKAIEGMKEFLLSGNRLNALVQGDVGSGKTIVAFFMMLLMSDNGYQSCIIAPTEVLAKQHYEELSELMKPFGINVGYLVGGLKAKEKRELLKDIENGSINMIVGTHAVLQDSVNFQNLGLVIIDEQHRFGVAQREKLLNLEYVPHLLTMSATPIPRTLSMALLGDVQVYNIFEKPKGRKKIKTQMVYSDKEAYDFMYSEISNGKQCYVVCPLIDTSDSDKMVKVKSASDEASAIEKYFENCPNVKVSLITGKMKQKDIAEEIEKFSKNEVNIMVSTTIIEVGVNVPNATVMLIKNSERFGLAQIHQLRGRVGRGDAQSYCLLQTPDKNNERANILCDTDDGFEIAKKDLLLRGTGDFIGTKQSGNNSNVHLMISNPELFSKISLLVKEIIQNKARLSKYSHLIITEEKDS